MLNQMTLQVQPQSRRQSQKSEVHCLSPSFLTKWCSHWTGEDRWEGVVLDHKRWPTPMKKAINDLLHKHRGQKDMLKLVDQD
ncbi:hypothetical protein FQN60_007119, partial [Etheostoma spectabile]